MNKNFSDVVKAKRALRKAEKALKKAKAKALNVDEPIKRSDFCVYHCVAYKSIRPRKNQSDEYDVSIMSSEPVKFDPDTMYPGKTYIVKQESRRIFIDVIMHPTAFLDARTYMVWSLYNSLDELNKEQHSEAYNKISKSLGELIGEYNKKN